MKTKLTLVVEDEVIYNAKIYAKKKEESLSSLVQNYLKAVANDEKATKNWKEDTADLMKELILELEKIEDFKSQNIENNVKEWITSKEIGFGKVMQPFRLSLVGAMKGPHLFDIAEMIGKEETIIRIKKAINTF